MRFPSFKNELKYLSEGYNFVAGCDEVGVSPLAGPVVAAACVLNPDSIGKYRTKHKWYYRVRDSKTTSEEEREVLVRQILKNTLAYGIGAVSHTEIDRINIHQATLKAMHIATEELTRKIAEMKARTPGTIFLFLDGRFQIPWEASSGSFALEQKNIVAGDREILSISAASIIAKVHRDGIMRKLDKKYPEYGFLKHKGYGTKRHKEAIRKFGASPFHRKSFLKSLETL